MPADLEPPFPVGKSVDKTAPKSKVETPTYIPPAEFISETQPTNTNPSSDQQKIQFLSQEIKIEATNLEVPATPKTETLFKNRSSLYEQHYERYDSECKTIKGYLHRQFDIHRFQKKGVKDAQELYDGLRARGIDRQQIISKNTYINSREITADEFLKGVDRLYKVNMIEPSTCFANKKGSTIEQISRIIKKTEQQFDVTYNTLNQYNFLRNSSALNELIMDNVYHFNQKREPILRAEWTLEELYRNFFSVPEIETAFNNSKSQLSEDDQKIIFDFLAYDSKNVDLLFRTLINSKTNPDQKIEIPHNLKSSFYANGESSRWVFVLSRLSNRDQQKHFVDNVQVEASSDLGELFSTKLLNPLEPKNQLLISSILSLKNFDKTMSHFLFANKDKLHSYFNENGQPTSLFFEELAKKNFHHTKYFKSNFTPEVNDSFSSEDKKLWAFMLDKNISLEENERVVSDDLLKLVIINKDQLGNNSTDIDFLNNLIGRFSKKSEPIIKGYLDSLNAGIISKKGQSLVLEFLNDFSVLTPNIIKGYKEAKQNHTEKLFISNLKEISKKLIFSKNLNETEFQSPYYQDLIQHVYADNANGWSNYESNNSCLDRSEDLSQFDIEDIYQIDLLSQGDIQIKAGEQIDINIQSRLEKPVLKVLENLQSINFDKEVGNQQLHQQADRLLSQINLPNIDLSKLSLEDKLFIVASESTYHQEINPNDIKNLLISYEFINFEDIRNFIQGTNDKVSQATNQAYAHLCELNSFFSDRIKEVNKKIIESASTNPEINKLFISYFQSLSQQNFQQSNQGDINKLQVDKLGLSSGFIDQITKTLQRRFPDKKYTPNQVIRMLHIYETVTEGLTEPKSTSSDKNTQAFYGQFRSQRDKTFALLEQLGSDYIDPRSIHLDEINLQQAVNLNQSIENGSYNQDEFLTYTAQKFVDIFSVEKSQLDTELSKYISESGSKRETLNAYITKTKSSAHARMVGGVCVSGDNPVSVNKQEQKNNQWDMPNYLQMVFQDPQTYRCVGLCLLHHFEENGKKILTVSFNPSSTYLYSVDESSLFTGMLNQIQDFAKKNNFDIITTSKNRTIRTNRTGGLFEQTIDKKVSKIGKTFSFSEKKQFSYHPDYYLRDMDIIWQKPTNR